MNPVPSRFPSRNRDPISRKNLLLLRAFRSDPDRDESDRATIDERLAEVFLIEDESAVDRRNAALVSPVLDPLADPRQNPFRVEQFFRYRPRIVGRGEAKDVHVRDRPRSKTGAEDISVDP